MKKLKVIIALWATLLGLFLYLDYKSYYYGFGFGFFNKKIPSRFEVVFAGSDLGNQGMLIQENFPSISVIEKNNKIYLDNSNNEIYVKKFVGYWFNERVIIAKVKDEKNRDKYLEIYEEMTNALDPKYICEERRYPPDEFYGLEYINIDKSLTYFKKFRLIKNLTFILLLFLSVYFLRLVYLKWRENKDNKNGWC